MREKILFDDNWLFHRGDIDIPFPKVKGPVYTSSKTERMKMGPACKDYVADPYGYSYDKELKGEKWEKVTLPHDYVISQTPCQNENETLGYFKYSNSWYRKEFDCSAEDITKRVSLYFEGIATHAVLYLNGCLIVRNFCGYTSFEADISDYVRVGKNVIAVYATTQEHEGWWYEGGGIYRHVWLVKSEKVCVDLWGVYIHPKKLSGDSWEIPVETTVLNDTVKTAAVDIIHKIKKSDNSLVCELKTKCEIPPFSKETVCTSGNVKNPDLWNIFSPTLYYVTTEIYIDNILSDSVDNRFGFRTIEVDADRGLFINGIHTVINGVCAHQDFGITGKAVSDNVQRYKIRLIKEMGANGYRTSHYPHSETTMDALDEQGFIVMDETRWFESSADGISQLEMLVKRDRNRPSVFFWSIGNEEPYTTIDEGRRISQRMAAAVKRLDNTRFVTMALSHINEGIRVCENLDVIGINYNLENFDKVHAKYPDKPIISSECCATGTTRGWYFDDCPEKGYASAYDKDTTNWFLGREKTVRFFNERKWVMGSYQWTAFEHRGESTQWPRLCSMSGAIDLYLQKKDAFYQNQSFWIKDRPVLSILPHWNFRGLEGEKINVWAYTNCEEVELFLNGESLGRKNVGNNCHVQWQTAYHPGVIKAVGYNQGKEVIFKTRHTTGNAEQLMLKIENSIKANGKDVAVISCYAVDSDGSEVPDASPLVSFNSNRLGTVIGTGSDNTDIVPVTSTLRKMFSGRITVAVKVGEETGILKVYAHSQGLKSAVLNIELYK